MSASFQSTVNVQNAFGVPGALYDDGPVRAAPWQLNSASAAYNVVGATAYTLVSADPANQYVSGVAQAGGTTQFVGILMNSKEYATSGPSTGAIDPTLTLPNYVIGDLLTMGDIVVQIPTVASVGDYVCYDNTTGKLSTYPKNASFTGALSTGGTLTVSAITAGQIQIGQVISGTNVPPGTYITALGTGLGGTGTYTTNQTSISAVAPEAMTAPSLPPVAAAFTAAMSSTGTLSVTAVGSGQLNIGSVIYGASVPSNTAITGLGTGEGGTGTYTTNYTGAAITSESMTADATTKVPGAEVYRFAAAGGNNLAVIKLTN
jgi:hypothetical protein